MLFSVTHIPTGNTEARFFKRCHKSKYATTTRAPGCGTVCVTAKLRRLLICHIKPEGFLWYLVHLRRVRARTSFPSRLTVGGGTETPFRRCCVVTIWRAWRCWEAPCLCQRCPSYQAEQAGGCQTSSGHVNVTVPCEHNTTGSGPAGRTSL